MGIPADSDDSLRTAFNSYLQRSRMNGEFATIWDRQFGRTNVFEHVDSRTFMRHFKRRLPRYQNEFQATAERYGLDWRLLAALSYQESHWDSKAVSPTGVKGLMMLTSNTASSLGVDRHDASQSIDGAARYLVRLQARMPSRIAEPDRTWFALAAYNVGYGHLEDARRLTQQQGGNPDHWADVARNLPLLSRPEWHSKTRHGYARGGEPVYFVRNIRHYYDALVWLDYRTARGDPANRMLAATDSVPSSVM